MKTAQEIASRQRQVGRLTERLEKVPDVGGSDAIFDKVAELNRQLEAKRADFVQVHDYRSVFQASPDELPVIDIHRLWRHSMPRADSPGVKAGLRRRLPKWPWPICLPNCCFSPTATFDIRHALCENPEVAGTRLSTGSAQG